VKHPFWSIAPKVMFGSVSRHFTNLRHVKEAKLVFEPECTISGYQSCEASFLVHCTQNDVWKCYEAFHKPSAGKTWKPHVSGRNAIFRGTKVVKHPFYPLDPKMIFGSVSKHFANLRHVKMQNSYIGSECSISGYQSCKYFGAFHKPSAGKRWKTHVSGRNAIFRGIKVVEHPL
jgi:hypothetical protein